MLFVALYTPGSVSVYMRTYSVPNISTGMSARRDSAGSRHSAAAYEPSPGLKPYAVKGLATECVFYDGSFLEKSVANKLYETLRTTMKWEKTSKINRWVALVGDKREDQKDYKYRDQPSQGLGDWTPELLDMKRRAEKWYNERNRVPLTNSSSSSSSSSSSTSTSNIGDTDVERVQFNVCLLNFYENGMHRIGWHADREEIGRSTPIASISLGAHRRFDIRSKKQNYRNATVGSRQSDSDSAQVILENGSICVMDNICQHQYVHAIPRDPDLLEGRINLTFRCKTDHTAGERMHERRSMVENDFLNDNLPPLPPNMISHPLPCSDSDKSFGSGHLFGSTCLRDIAPEPSDVRWLINAQLGVEMFVAGEVEEMTSTFGCTVVARPWGLPGYVSCSTGTTSGKDRVLEKLLTLRSALNVLEYHHHFALSDVAMKATSSTESISKKRDGSDDLGPPICKKAKTQSTSAGTQDTISVSALAYASASESAANPLESVPRPDNGVWRKLEKPKPKKPAHPSAEDIYAHVKKLLACNTFRISTLEDASVTKFRVSSNRIGNHPFKSVNIEYEVGGAIDEHYSHLSPSMKRYDILIRCDVIGGAVVLGTQCNSQNMSKRHKLKFVNRVTIKSNLAYVLLRAAAVQQGDRILDPFCGSGTLLLEAAEWLKGRIQCIGLDVNRSTISGAKKNAAAEGMAESTCQFHCKDARALRSVCPDESLDAIVTNLPWGVQTGKHADLEQLYEVMLRTGWYALKPGGRLVVLVLRGLQMMRILRKLSGRYRVVNGGFQVVKTTNNLPCICVVEKLAEDKQHDALKRQLYFYSQFVSIGSEMYKAIHMEDTNTKKLESTV